MNPAQVRRAERDIAIANQLLRCFIPRERFGYLPRVRRIGGHADSDQPSSGMVRSITKP